MSPGRSLKIRVLLVAAVAALFASDSTWAEPKLGDESPDFPPIYFYAGSSELDEEARERCQNVASHMLKNPSLRLTLRGGTDPTGTVRLNRRLGRQRAEAAKRAIVAKGVAANRIRVVKPQLASEGGENRFLRFVKFYFTGTASVAAAPVTPVTPPPTPGSSKTSAPSVAKTSASTSAPSKTPSGPETLRVIFWRAPNHMLLAIAKSMGYFRDEGLNVVLVESQNDARDIAKELDVGWRLGTAGRTASTGHGLERYFAGGVCSYGFNDVVKKKRALVQIGTLITLADTFLMKKELAAAMRADIKAIRGKTIAMLTGDQQAFTGAVENRFKAVGLAKGRDFQLKFYPNTSKMLKDLIDGKVHLASTSSPIDIAFLRKHPDYDRFQMAALFPYLPCCRQLVPRSSLVKNRAKYIKFERALIRAERLFIENPKRAHQIIAGYLKVPPNVVKQIYQGAVTMGSDPNVKGSAALLRYSGVSSDVGEFLDTSIYAEAAESLAKENPNVAFYKSILRRFRRQN